MSPHGGEAKFAQLIVNVRTNCLKSINHDLAVKTRAGISAAMLTFPAEWPVAYPAGVLQQHKVPRRGYQAFFRYVFRKSLAWCHGADPFYTCSLDATSV